MFGKKNIHYHFHPQQMCNNCKTHGHLFNQCNLPIASFGIILVRQNSARMFEYLMIRRKDSFAFAAFIRGKYEVQNIEFIQNLIDEMSNDEKHRIINFSFEELWKQMSPFIKIDNHSAHKKFNILKTGVQIDGKIINLNDLVLNSSSMWSETEWEFPKGRRNKNENDIDCALREFGEETGFNKNNISVVENVLPFEETFIGSNHRSYKHTYFLAYCKNNSNINGKHQQAEVSKVKWKTYQECITSIRPHHLVKLNLITQVNQLITNYPFFYC